MLSEIELKAHSTLFLCDLYDDCDQTQDTVETSSNQSQEDPETQTLFPPYCILYILWRPNMVSSVRAFTEVVIQDCIQKLKDASKNNSRIYLVVDTLVPSGPNADADADDASAERRYQAQLHVAETLARHVAQDWRWSWRPQLWVPTLDDDEDGNTTTKTITPPPSHRWWGSCAAIPTTCWDWPVQKRMPRRGSYSPSPVPNGEDTEIGSRLLTDPIRNGVT
jgi:hypothetical protein